MLRRWRRRRDEIICIQFVEVVTNYLDDALAPGDRARFEEHLAACPDCSRYLSQIRTTVELSGRLTAADVDALGPDARAELLAAFRSYRD